MSGPFTFEIDRLEISGLRPDARQLRPFWNPVSQKVIILLEWGKGIHYIGEPFDPSQPELKGPGWAVEMCKAREHIHHLVNSTSIDRDETYRCKRIFLMIVYKCIYILQIKNYGRQQVKSITFHALF